MIADDALADDALRILTDLLRIDSRNPPGDERLAAEYTARQLAEVGLDPIVLESDPGRANVVARLKGDGREAPLILTGHLDVVPVDETQWTHPPFDGVVGDDGCLYGRGAVDMKNHVAMCLAVIRRLARDQVPLRRDIVFAAVADEEQGCRSGSLWLCREHPDLVRGEYALGEGGGFSLHIGGTCFYPLQIAEKGVCWVEASIEGPPGHGSMPRADSAVLGLARAIAPLHGTSLPAHRTPIVEEFLAAVIDELAPSIPGLRGAISQLVTWPSALRPLIARIPDSTVRLGLLAQLANTASPTVLRAGDAVNVIPGRASVRIDGRILPGQTEESFLAELRAVMGDDVRFEVEHSMPPILTEPSQNPLRASIEHVMAEEAPGCPVIPYMLPGFTDAKGFDSIGVKWVGFAPVKLPKDLRYADLFHAHDERIPVEGHRWGAKVLGRIVTHYCA